MKVPVNRTQVGNMRIVKIHDNKSKTKQEKSHTYQTLREFIHLTKVSQKASMLSDTTAVLAVITDLR